MICYSCYKYLLLRLKRFVYRCFLIATIGNVYLKNGLFSYLQEEAENYSQNSLQNLSIPKNHHTFAPSKPQLSE